MWSDEVDLVIRISAAFSSPPAQAAGPSASDSNDPLPEFATYRDEGCRISPQCQNCPLERCIEDSVPAPTARDRKKRDLVILKLYFEKKKPIKEIAFTLDVSRRTVERSLSKIKAKNRTVKK